ncbi:MAG: RNA polymerase sigma factor [Pseudomonadales bacterium]|nr:RNA polymerase sigma factor [Pseudomonadales bacterium]
MNSGELKLLKAVAEGDKRAMASLYECYMPRLWRFLYRITRDSDLIQELTNDVMLTVWQKAEQFRQESTVSTWILGIAYRKALDAIRHQKRYRNRIEQLPEPAVQVNDVNALIVDRDLDKLLDNLTTEQRAVAELSFGFGYSYPEIAEILGIPVNTVKTRMYYARKSMQASFEGERPGGPK